MGLNWSQVQTRVYSLWASFIIWYKDQDDCFYVVIQSQQNPVTPSKPINFVRDLRSRKMAKDLIFILPPVLNLLKIRLRLEALNKESRVYILKFRIAFLLES